MPRISREPKILTLDTETIGFEGALKRIAVYDGERVTYGYTFADVLPQIEWYFDMGYMPHVYIHNFDFDGRKIPEIFNPGNVLWNTTKKIANRYARLTCVKYTIHDSFKIFPNSLAKLSKDFELEHGKLDLWDAVQKAYPGQYTDHVDFLNRCDKDDPLYMEYLGYDVISLYELIQKMMEIAKMNEARFVKILSTASLSRTLLREGYGDITFQSEEYDQTDFEILTQNKAWSSPKTMKHSKISYIDCENKIRQGYYGGRTEVFTPICQARPDGGIAAFHYDVNSLYPSVMIDKEYPVGYPDYMTEPTICRITWETWLQDRQGLGFITATVYVPPQQIPPLPSKMGKLVFVTGWQRGTWTYNELEYAVSHCGVEIKEFIEIIHFKKTFPVFHNFVETFYQLKEQGSREKNGSLRSFAKLILNTAYGWTALRRDDKTCLRDMRKLEEWQGKDPEKILYVNEDLGFFEMRDTVNTPTVQVQIGAYVTSYARLVLLDALRKQAEHGTVYYCDTDSIVCSAQMAQEDCDPYQIGKWDLESKLYSGIFLQPKVYTEHKVEQSDTIKFKGITKGRQKELKESNYLEWLGYLQEGRKDKIIIERNRRSLPTLAVAQKNGTDPNKMNVMDKGMNLGAKQKREIDYQANISSAWHMESIEQFDNFSFETFDNKPSDKNIFGG